jgi:hypothetical protein
MSPLGNLFCGLVLRGIVSRQFIGSPLLTGWVFSGILCLAVAEHFRRSPNTEVSLKFVLMFLNKTNAHGLQYYEGRKKISLSV